MADLSFEFENGIDATPDNWQELAIDMEWVSDNPIPMISTNKWEFSGERSKEINKHISAGLTGGVGIFEGKPFYIRDCGFTFFDGALHTPNGKYWCDRTEVEAIETNRVNSFYERARSFSMAYLATPVADGGAGTITSSDYVAVPYIVSSIPNTTQAAMFAFSTFILVKEVAETIERIANVVADTSNPLTSFNGVVKMIALVIYLVAVIYGCIKMIEATVENLIQLKDKFKYGMRARTLFEKGCKQIGIDNFVSSIFTDTSSPYYNYAIIPRKYVRSKKDADDKKNPDAFGYYEGTFEQFTKDMQLKFNAKPFFSADGKTMYFENINSYNEESGYIMDAPFVMPDIRNINNTYAEPVIVNADEIAANYEVIYQTDSNDLNTFDRYEGTSTQLMLLPKIINHTKNNFLKGLEMKSLPFALAKRKVELTKLEDIFNDFITIVDDAFSVILDIANGAIAVANAGIEALNKFIDTVNSILNFFGADGIDNVNPIDEIPNSGNLITKLTGRIGYLALSSDFIGVPKVCILAGNSSEEKLHENNQLWTSAKYLMDTFHSTSWGSPNRGNQYLKVQGKEINFCCEDFEKVKRKRVFLLPDGTKCKFDKIAFTPATETAVVDFRVPMKFTDNIKETFIIDGEA